MYEALKLAARMHLPSEKNMEMTAARLNTERSWHGVQHLYFNFFHCLCSTIYLTSLWHMCLNGYSSSRVWRISFKPWFNCEIIQSFCPIWWFKQTAQAVTHYVPQSNTNSVCCLLRERRQQKAARKAVPWQRLRLYRLIQCVFNAQHVLTSRKQM